MFSRIEVRHLVNNFGVVFERDQPMRKPDRNKYLETVFGTNNGARIFAECWRAIPDIDHDVKNSPSRHADEFILRERWGLKMQATQRTASRRQ